MKSLGRFFILALAWLVAVSGLSAEDVVSEVTPPKPGTVSADRVNVRARASLIGERVTQLRKGDKVSVLAKVTVAPPRKNEPVDWLRIVMPAAGQTWVYLGFVEEGKVTVKKLNVRAGDGERFSIVGRLAKGDVVKEKRTAGDWIEIEHPPGAYAYIAAKFIDVGEADEEAEPEETPEAKPVAEEVTETKELEATKPETADVTGAKGESEKTTEPAGLPEPPEPEVVVVADAGGTEASDTQKLPMGNPEDAEAAKPETVPDVTETKLPVPPPRIVTREGKIKRRIFRSPKAPSRFELLNENGRTINYLYSSDSGPLKTADGEDGEPITFERLMGMLRNRRVILTGIEAVDPRWPSLPLLDVRTLKTLT